MNKIILFSLTWFLGNLILPGPAMSQTSKIFSSGLLHEIEGKKDKILAKEDSVLQRLTIAAYLNKSQKDSLLNMFLALEQEYGSYSKSQVSFLQKRRKTRMLADSINSYLYKRAAMIDQFKVQYPGWAGRSMGDVFEQIKMDEEMRQFPYCLNDRYYLVMAEKLFNENKLIESGRIFYRLDNIPGNKEVNHYASVRLTEIQNTLFRQSKEQLLGSWKHFDRRTTCYDYHSKPVSLNKKLSFDDRFLRIMENDSCTLQSEYTLKPVFWWEMGTMHLELFIAAKNETWSIDPGGAASQPAIWLHYPPPVPYTTAQTYDIFDKELPVKPGTATVRN